jgi:hypothetical protein
MYIMKHYFWHIYLLKKKFCVLSFDAIKILRGEINKLISTKDHEYEQQNKINLLIDKIYGMVRAWCGVMCDDNNYQALRARGARCALR